MDKLQQAKQIENAIKDLTRHKELVLKIVALWIQEKPESPHPYLGMKVSPQRSDFMPLLPQYVPLQPADFYEKYLKNINDHMAQLNDSLTNLFS